MTSEMVVLIIVLSWFAFVFDTIMSRRKSTSHDRVGNVKGGIMPKGKIAKNIATILLCGVTVVYCNLIYEFGKQDGNVEGRLNAYEDILRQIKEVCQEE